MSYFNVAAFAVFPYIAVAICFIGAWLRYDREQYTWKTGSSQILESKWLRRGSIVFHIGILGILFGHLVGLLTPVAVWHFVGIEAAAKQLLAIVAGGLFGLLTLVGLTILILRRLLHPRVRATSSNMDIAILFLLLAQLLLGLGSIFVSLGHLDGSEMLLLMSWAQSIVTFQAIGAVEAISSVHWIFKAHVLLGMVLFIVAPFSRLVHVLSAPMKYLGRRYQVVRYRGSKPEKSQPSASRPTEQAVFSQAPNLNRPSYTRNAS